MGNTGISYKFRGVPIPAYAALVLYPPKRSPAPMLWADMSPFWPWRVPGVVKATYGSEVKLGELADAFGTTEAVEHV